MTFNNRLRQIILLLIIILLGYVLINQLFIFLPGFLGAITLYILSREWFFRILEKNKKWKKSLLALLFVFGYLIIIGLPVYVSIKLLSPKINSVFSHQQEVIQGVKLFTQNISEYTGTDVLDEKSIKNLQSKISSFVPSFLSSTANILANLFMMFFLLYYFLVNGKAIEKFLLTFIPLEQRNVDLLAVETKHMVKANALGIPLISLIQGLFAAIGYWIFGIKDWGLWGFITGVFAFFPFVGTMIIWVPLVIYIYSINLPVQALGLCLYSLLVTGNVDYVARVTLMKKIGDVHPLITVFGVIVGLGLFGFMGFIFGPLLISYFIILSKIYINEFGSNKSQT